MYLKLRRRSIVVTLVTIVAIILVTLTACRSTTGPAAPKVETSPWLSPATDISPDDLETVLSRDAIPAIVEPRFDSASTAQAYMKPDEQVIGLTVDGEPRAYPINILGRHEIVNDVAGGEPIAVTWCPLCYSALVFSRQVDGQVLTFGVSGKLYQNNLIMYDRQTDSLWSQLLGQAISGPLAGEQLRLLPSNLTTWQDWRAEHPDTLVLSKPKTLEVFHGTADVKDPMHNYSVDRYRSYYASEDRGVVNSNIPEEAVISAKRRVLGLRFEDAIKAYDFRDLAKKQVVHDTVAGLPVLIVFDPDSENGAGFDRRLDDQVLSFTLIEDGERLILRDEQTGTLWNGLTGRAVSGPWEGRQLSRLPTTYAFWFAWKAHFPDTQVYSIDEDL